MTQDNHSDDTTATGEQSFSELLKASYDDSPGSIQVGDRIKGKVISIGREHIFVDTGFKVDGIVERAELADEEGNLPCEEGDMLDLFVVSRRGGEIKLSRAISGVGGLTILEDAHEKSIPIEGKVLEQCKGGFRVEVVKRKAFCPISQMDIVHIEKPEKYVGQTYLFLITEFEEDGKNIVLSRKTILEDDQKKAKEAFYDTMEVGSILEGSVTKIMPYGALVELASGVEGMVHVSEMSWSRTLDPNDIVHPGERIRVKILAVEEDRKSGRKRISLSMKQVDDDPWNSVLTWFKPGDKLRGKVTRCAEFGVFVELTAGIEGLVHISEMSYKTRVKKPQDMVSVGDEVDVLIKDIDPQSRKISLSMKDAEGDPWIGIKDRYLIDQAVEGTIEKKERFGYFVRLEPGITGLLPKSKIVQHHDAANLDKKHEGETITVTIESIDTEQRKISLSPGDKNEEGEWKGFASDSKGTSFGSLADKLKSAMNSKKKKEK
jgi:small subunit ribosomal protein S1